MKWRAEAILLPLALAGCVGGPERRPAPFEGRAGDLVGDTPVKVGAPYRVRGRTYVPADDRTYAEEGLASWYGAELAGQPTANGERFRPEGVSAAHRTLPLPSYARVTSLDTGRSVVVRVNDRGPFAEDRIIDLSRGAARIIGLSSGHVGRVRVERVEPSEADRERLRQGRPALADSAPVTRTSGTDPLPPRPADGAWIIQLGAFSSRERAETMARAADARVERGGGVYRVRVGPFTDGRRARAALERLRAAGYDGAAFVVVR